MGEDERISFVFPDDQIQSGSLLQDQNITSGKNITRSFHTNNLKIFGDCSFINLRRTIQDPLRLVNPLPLHLYFHLHQPLYLGQGYGPPQFQRW